MASTQAAAAVLESSVAAAAATGAAFLGLGLLAGTSFYLTRFKTYILLAASGVLRGVGLILRARASQLHDAGMLAAWQALSAAGFGMAIGVICLINVSWYRNASVWGEPPSRQPFARRAARLAGATVPLVIACGPLLGAVAAGLMYGGGGTAAAMNAAQAVRKASVWGMLAVIVLMTLITATGCVAAAQQALAAARRRRQEAAQQQQKLGGESAAVVVVSANGSSSGGSSWACSDLMMLLVLPAALALDVAAAQRAAASLDPHFLTSDAIYYPMAIAPELLNMVIMALVPTLMARIGMCGNYQRHLEAVGRRQTEVAAGAVV